MDSGIDFKNRDLGDVMAIIKGAIDTGDCDENFIKIVKKKLSQIDKKKVVSPKRGDKL